MSYSYVYGYVGINEHAEFSFCQEIDVVANLFVNYYFCSVCFSNIKLKNDMPMEIEYYGSNGGFIDHPGKN